MPQAGILESGTKHAVPRQMRAAVVQQDGSVQVLKTSYPDLPPGGALIDVTGCGLCGSDVDKLTRRPLSRGIILGHEVVGRVRTLSPAAHTALKVGQRVAVAHHVACQTCYYCRHQSPSMCRQFKTSNLQPGGFSQMVAVTSAHLAQTVFPLPNDVTDETGSCIEPLACCIRAIEKIPANIGHSMLVIGLGFIGAVTAQYARYKGYTVFGSDINPTRVDLVQKQHWAHHAAANAALTLNQIDNHTHGRGVDCVFLSVVTPQTLQLALDAVRDGGTIIVFAASPASTTLLDQNALYFRELTVLTSYSPSVEAFALAQTALFSGQINVRPFFDAAYPLTGLQQAIYDYQNGTIMKAFIQV